MKEQKTPSQKTTVLRSMMMHRENLHMQQMHTRFYKAATAAAAVHKWILS
jgi:hypothetical protein